MQEIYVEYMKSSLNSDTVAYCICKVKCLTLILSIALGYYVVAINGSHPMIRWEMKRGLDLTISSVAGESYTVDVSSSVEETCFQWFMMYKFSVIFLAR